MAHITAQQTRRLGTFELTRNGIDLVGGAADAVRPLACWNFALTGTETGMAGPQSPDTIYHSNGVGQNPAHAILDVAIYPPACNGLRASATVANHPGCGVELASLNTHMANARAGNGAAQQACAEAMVRIVARKNGLTPGVADDRYQLHMVGTNWFSWDHWALSFRPVLPGKPRIFVQTVTGVPLSHACSTIWDEHLTTRVTINIAELHQAQVDYINLVTGYGKLCIACGAKHGMIPSAKNMWHRCTGCQSTYCPSCGSVLPGKRGLMDGTRQCNQIGCINRTQLISWP